jgi:hypothetical protein
MRACGTAICRAGRSAAEQRVEQELYEATYARLKGNGDIVNVTYDVHLGDCARRKTYRRGGSEGGRLRGCERRAERNVGHPGGICGRVPACH